MYIRLSNADEETGRKKDESDSIVNQRALINHFLDSSPELRNIPRDEFVDDGFTGKNMDRPRFQDMIRLIKEGRYNICITKDFSRFSRDYIEMGDYLECLFPFLHVRYISINDNYDSNECKNTTGGLDVAMKTFIYDSYSRDLSEKVKSGQRQSALKGRRISGYPAYGYMMDPDNKAMDIIDPEASKVVKEIFDGAIGGLSLTEIANKLSEEGIMTPAEYSRSKHPGSKGFCFASEKHKWSAASVAVILKRYTYTGVLVEMQTEAVGPCMKKRIKNPHERWIIVPGMHEAIVSVEEFKEAQKIFNKNLNRRKEKVEKKYPLKSMLICGSCGRHLVRSRIKGTSVSPFFFCQYRTEFGNDECKMIRSPREDELNKIVYDAIMRMISFSKIRIGKASKVNKIMKKEEDTAEKMREEIDTFRRDMLREYEAYAMDRISKEEFKQRKMIIEERIKKKEGEIADHKSRIDLERDSCGPELKSICGTFDGVKNLTNEMVKAFIKKIVVNPGNEIEIKWKFKDPFYQDA